MSIPKIIHYVWLGDRPLSRRDADFTKGWQKLNPDFTIKHWTEKDLDIAEYPLIGRALAEKKWALAADIIRMHAVYTDGGIYLDTDIELLKPLDPLLKYDGFAGWESNYWFTTAAFGAKKHSPWIHKILQRYRITDEKITTDTFLKTVHSPSVYATDIYGVKSDGKTHVYADGKFATFSSEYFSPKHYITGELQVTNNTIAIHHYASTWHSKAERAKTQVTRTTYKTLGPAAYQKLESSYHRQLAKKIRKDLP